MAFETSLFAPTLIDAMHRVVAIDGLSLIVNLQIALVVVAVMIQYDVYRSINLWRDTEDGSMTGACNFQFQSFVWQTYCIVVRMRCLF